FPRVRWPPSPKPPRHSEWRVKAKLSDNTPNTPVTPSEVEGSGDHHHHCGITHRGLNPPGLTTPVRQRLRLRHRPRICIPRFLAERDNPDRPDLRIALRRLPQLANRDRRRPVERKM